MGVITFLTDFGLEDDFVGVCHGVMKRIAPDVEIIDVTHGIGPQAVLQGALVLAHTTPYMPVGVHVAVVDPGVGGSRRPVAVRDDAGRIFVGPDNGLLTPAAERDGIAGSRELTNARFHLERVSRTFHARDLFAPVAAHLASGVPFEDVGDAVDPATLIRLEIPEPSVHAQHLRATVLAVDRFGNIQLNLRKEHVAALELADGDRVELRFPLDSYYAILVGTFADAAGGELILYEDSYGAYSIAISHGDAAALTGAKLGDQLRIVRT